MGFFVTKIRNEVASKIAAKQLLLHMNRLHRWLIPARQRESLGERRGSEAWTPDDSVSQDWGHWCMLAGDSPVQPRAPVLHLPRRRHVGLHTWDLSSWGQEHRAVRLESRPGGGCPHERGGSHWMVSLMMGRGAGREGSRRDWKPNAVFQLSKPHRLLSNVKQCPQTTQHTLLPLPKDTH